MMAGSGILLLFFLFILRSHQSPFHQTLRQCASEKKKKKAVAAHHVINTALSQGSRIATGYIWERRNLRPPKVFKNTVLRKKKKISMQILFFFFFFFSFSIAMSMI